MAPEIFNESVITAGPRQGPDGGQVQLALVIIGGLEVSVGLGDVAAAGADAIEQPVSMNATANRTTPVD
jgi:hypothetical protein